MAGETIVPDEVLMNKIYFIKGQKVMLDNDLAELYGVETKRLKEQVKRNILRFPERFMFELTKEENFLLRSQIATLKPGRGQHRKYMPYAFTEHGAIMAATILNSPRATEVSVYVVRAFVQLREVLASNAELAKRLNDLERSTEAKAMQHDIFARNTRAQLKQVFDAIRELMTPPVPQKKRPIGFISGDEKPKKN